MGTVVSERSKDEGAELRIGAKVGLIVQGEANALIENAFEIVAELSTLGIFVDMHNFCSFEWYFQGGCRCLRDHILVKYVYVLNGDLWNQILWCHFEEAVVLNAADLAIVDIESHTVSTIGIKR